MKNQYPRNKGRVLTRLPWSMAAIVLTILAIPVARAQIYQVNAMPHFIIHQASNSQVGSPPSWFATRPHAYGFDASNGTTITRHVFLSWLVNPDYYPGTSDPYPHLSWRRLSADAGETWGAASNHTVSNAAAMSMIRRRDGTMVALSFRPAEGYFKSTNNGVTWTKYTDGTVKASDGVTPMIMLFHRSMLEENNGDLYAMGYSAKDSILLKSTNGGKDWVHLSTPADGNTDGDGFFYNEATIERCTDGSWLVVARVEDIGTNGEMRARRSANKGVSWMQSGTTLLPGLPTRPNTNAKRDCDPQLKLMANGVLVLAYGPNVDTTPSMSGASRDCVIAFSNDGIGASWTNGTTLIDAVAYDPSDGSPAVGLESSGYMDVVPVSAHRFLTVGDTGHTWSYSTSQLTPNPYKIWGRYVDIVRAPHNRIDLKTMVELNPSIVTTDLTYSNAAHPEVRIAGAVDGSNDYWSGAFKSGASGVSGTYTIDLQRDYTINHVGVCMQYNTAQSAVIQVATSLAGPWTNVATHTNIVTNALKYTSVTPINARYVRATVTAASGQTLVCLNELEVYTTAQSFENCGQNTVPYSFDAPPNGGFWVSEGVGSPTGYKSQRALYMEDLSTATEKSITQTWSTATSKTLEFMLEPVAYASGGAIQWRILSGSTIAFRFRTFSSTGQIQWYNGSTYTNITNAFAPINTWTRIKVVATATAGSDTAAFYIHNGSTWTQYGGTIGSENNVSNMNKLQFTSGGMGASGDKALFDDVYMN